MVLKCFSDGEPTPSVYWKYSVNGKGKLLRSIEIHLSASLTKKRKKRNGIFLTFESQVSHIIFHTAVTNMNKG